MKHVVIIPARNEAERIQLTLESLLGQSLPPDRIYVVDDGSTDTTPMIVGEIGRNNPSVILVHKEDRGYRLMGGGVVETFNAAYCLVEDEKIEYVSKIDADLIFPKDYFKILLDYMDVHPQIASASGVLFDHIGDKRQRLRTPDKHVPGPLKTIRKSVFDAIGGFQSVYGWDIIDQVNMRLLGYETATLEQLEVEHLRQHGSAEGALDGRATWGKGAWIIGSHPLFVLARGAYRMLEPPYMLGGLAFWYGYLRAAWQKVPQIEDKALIQALRREQLYRLRNGNRLPSRETA